MTCGSVNSYWWRYEVEGHIQFIVPQGVSDDCASENIMRILDPSYISEKSDSKVSDLPIIKKPIMKNYTNEIRINAEYNKIILSRRLQVHMPLIFDLKSFHNSDSLQVNRLKFKLRKSFTNEGTLYSEESLFIITKSFVNQEDKQIGAMKDVYIETSDFANETKSIVFSQEGDIEVISTSIDNQKATIHAGGILKLNSNNNINNQGGLLQAMDSTRESLIKCHEFVNSEQIETKIFIFRYDIITSPPGTLNIAGNCKLACKLFHIGIVRIGGKIYNEKDNPFYIESKTIGQTPCLFSANAADLTVKDLCMGKVRFAIGTGGLTINSMSRAIMYNDYSQVCIENEYDPYSFALCYPSIFMKDENGIIRLRHPMKDEYEWNTSLILAQKDDQGKNIQFMITPGAFKYLISLMPTEKFGYPNIFPSTFLSLIQFNDEQNSNQMCTKEMALHKSSPSLVWNIMEKESVLCYYPIVVIPKKFDHFYAQAQISSFGDIRISAKEEFKIKKVDVASLGDIKIKSNMTACQLGGKIVSNSTVKFEAPKTLHLSCVKKSWFGTFLEPESEKDIPIVKSKWLKERGDTFSQGLQVEANSYDHDKGINVMTPLVFKKFNFKRDRIKSINLDTYTTYEDIIPSRIIANEAHFHGETILKGTLAKINEIYKYDSLKLEPQVLTKTCHCHGEKSGFFRNTKVDIHERHESIFTTKIKGNELKDLNQNNKNLIMISSSIDVKNMELQNDIIQKTQYLRHEEHCEVKTSGISLTWFTDARPAIFRSICSLMDAQGSIDCTSSFIQMTTNIFNEVNDTVHVITDAAYTKNILKGIANRMTSFSIGTQIEKRSIQESIPVLNEIKGESLNITNKNTHFAGSVDFKEINIDTDNFSFESPTAIIQKKNEIIEKSLTVSPFKAIDSITAGILPTLSYSNTSKEVNERIIASTKMKSDKLNINVNNDMTVKGARIESRIVNANIKGNLTVESKQDEIVTNEETSSFSISLSLIS